MSLFNVFQVSSSAMTAQSMRLNTVASNLANADSIISSDGKPYRAKQVVFEATPIGSAGDISKGSGPAGGRGCLAATHGL